MVIMTHTMNLGRSKNQINQIVETIFSPEQNKLTLFAVIATKPVAIVFEKTLGNIKR